MVVVSAGGTGRQKGYPTLPVVQVNPMNEGKKHLVGYGDNLSVSGMFIATPDPKKPGDKITVVFPLPDGKDPVSARAEVVWARRDAGQSGEEPGMGIRFLDMDPLTVERLREFVTSDRK